MKRKIIRIDGCVEEHEGTPEELAAFDRAATVPSVPVLPGLDLFKHTTITYPPVVFPDAPGPCITEQFFKDNPTERVAMISCPCPRCSPHCLSA